MAYKVGTTIVIDDSGTVDWLQRDNQDENPASIRMRTRVWGHVGRA